MTLARIGFWMRKGFSIKQWACVVSERLVLTPMPRNHQGLPPRVVEVEVGTGAVKLGSRFGGAPFAR